MKAGRCRRESARTALLTGPVGAVGFDSPPGPRVATDRRDIMTTKTTTATEQRETLPPEQTPEYVGAHSGLLDDRAVCEHWGSPTRQSVSHCGDPATHTVVLFTGRLHEIAVCDEQGEPDDVTAAKREWSASKNYERG